MGTRFIAYLEQESEGCDYTIGCGVQLVLIDGDTSQEAIGELRALVLDGYRGEYRLKRATLYEVSDTNGMPIQNWYAEYEADQKRAALEQATAQERAEYDRLRQKYG